MSEGSYNRTWDVGANPKPDAMREMESTKQVLRLYNKQQFSTLFLANVWYF